MWARFAKSPLFPGLLAALILMRLISRGLSWWGIAALVVVLLLTLEYRHGLFI